MTPISHLLQISAWDKLLLVAHRHICRAGAVCSPRAGVCRLPTMTVLPLFVAMICYCAHACSLSWGCCVSIPHLIFATLQVPRSFPWLRHINIINTATPAAGHNPNSCSSSSGCVCPAADGIELEQQLPGLLRQVRCCWGKAHGKGQVDEPAVALRVHLEQAPPDRSSHHVFNSPFHHCALASLCLANTFGFFMSCPHMDAGVLHACCAAVTHAPRCVSSLFAAPSAVQPQL